VDNQSAPIQRYHHISQPIPYERGASNTTTCHGTLLISASSERAQEGKHCAAWAVRLILASVLSKEKKSSKWRHVGAGGRCVEWRETAK
jgi:hypothetical protein